MLFAELDANGWAAIIAAVGVIIVQIVTRVLGYLEHLNTTRTVKKVEDNVQKIETATNSMKDALVKATGDAQFLKGGEAERVKQAEAKAAVADAKVAAVVEVAKVLPVAPIVNVPQVLENIAEQVVVKLAEASAENKLAPKKEQVPVTLPPAQTEPPQQ